MYPFLQTSPATLENKRKLHLLNLPSFKDPTEGAQTLLRTVNWLVGKHEANISLSSLIFLHRISDKGLSQTALSNLILVQQLCGDDFLANCSVITTHWDAVELSAGEAEEKRLLESGDIFGHMIAMGSQSARLGSPAEASVLAIVDSIASRRQPMPWKIQHEMAAGLPVAQTEAGLYLSKILRELRLSHTKHLHDLETGLQAGIEIERIKESMEKLDVDGNQLAKRQQEQYEARNSQQQHGFPGKTSLGWVDDVDDPWWPCILSMDGGGVRGYSTLLILKSLMDEISKLEAGYGNSTLEQKFLPCHYFDCMCKFLRPAPGRNRTASSLTLAQSALGLAV